MQVIGAYLPDDGVMERNHHGADGKKALAHRDGYDILRSAKPPNTDKKSVEILLIHRVT